MSQHRRHFLQTIAATGGLFALSGSLVEAAAQRSPSPSALLQQLQVEAGVFQPLTTVTITGTTNGIFSIRDGKGHEYLRQPSRSGSLVFRVAGAIGNHTVILQDEHGKLLDFATFPVNCQTELIDSEAHFYDLFNILHRSMIGYDQAPCYARVLRINQTDRFYHYFVSWLRDHVHVLKGLKYFYPELKSGIDLYADFQRHDGMIWDNVEPRTPEKNIWDLRLPMMTLFWRLKTTPLNLSVFL